MKRTGKEFGPSGGTMVLGQATVKSFGLLHCVSPLTGDRGLPQHGWAFRKVRNLSPSRHSQHDVSFRRRRYVIG